MLYAQIFTASKPNCFLSLDSENIAFPFLSLFFIQCPKSYACLPWRWLVSLSTDLKRYFHCWTYLGLPIIPQKACLSLSVSFLLPATAVIYSILALLFFPQSPLKLFSVFFWVHFKNHSRNLRMLLTKFNLYQSIMILTFQGNKRLSYNTSHWFIFL